MTPVVSSTIQARASAPEPAGRFPGTVVATATGRKAVRSGALWGSVFAAFIIAQTLAYTSAYPTQASRDQFAAAYRTNAGLNALIGPIRDINTVSGYASWRLLGILSILGAVWGLLTSTRLMRGDEEAGRYDLLLTGQTTPRRAAGQAVAGLGAGLGCLFIATTIGAIVTGRASSVGFGPGQCLYFSLTLAAAPATFLAVGALAGQLVSTRRDAAALAGVVFGVSYAMRMVADARPGLSWMVWLSPLGWIERSAPLTHPRPLALLPVLALVLALALLAIHLAGTRDVGTGTLPTRDTAPSHLRLLGHPWGLALRLMRPSALGWLFAVGALAVLLGTVAASSTQDIRGAAEVQRAVGRLGGHGSPTTAYLGLTFLILALTLAMIAAGQVTAIRAEEAEGHLENFLVRPESRASWLSGRMALSAALILLAGILAGTCAWAGTATQPDSVAFASLIAAGLNLVPPALFILGLGALNLGIRPRRTAAVVYGYLSWAFLIEFVGATMHVNHWIQDTSVFFHMVPAPASSPNWTSAAVITVIAVIATAVGATAFDRRDLVPA